MVVPGLELLRRMRAGLVLAPRVPGAVGRWIMATEVVPVEASAEAARQARSQRRLRFALALGIVVASISSAVAGAGAELYYEHSSQAQGLFRQALIAVQQREQRYESDIASDLRQFGTYEQDVVLGHLLRRDAQTAHGALADRLQSDAFAAEQLAALHWDANFLWAWPSRYTEAAPAIDPAGAYADVVVGSPDLEAVDPARLHEEAWSDRRSAVNMTGVAAVFVIALVLLTLSQMRIRRSPDRAARTVSTMSATLAALGATVWIIGVTLAFVVVFA